VIAHDVKRPIVMATMIVNILENIKSISELESLIPMFRSNLKKATDDISGVLEDITLIGGTVDMSNETTVPLEVIHESIEAFRDTDNRAQYKEVTFKIEILTELSLLGEKRRWKRSLINLFENAAKASNGMSEVSIKVENVGGTSAGTLKVNVHNTNSFIPDEIIQKIMIGSYSGNGGTGLGLTMIRGMVKSIGGTISCSSNSKHGTSFVLAVPGRKTSSSLPIDHKSSIPNIQSVQINHLPRGPYSNKDFVGLVEALKRKLRVFIIDDETSYADIVSQSIKSNEAISSYIEIAHFKGREDLTACLTRVSLPADIYIVDMNYETHEYDGIDIIREIKRSVPNALVCLCSNHIDHYSRTKAKESGADWVIPKPISAEHIIKMLGERLENQQPSSNSLLEPCRAEIIESDFRKIVLMKSVLQKENVQFSFFNSLAEFLESDKNTSSANVFLSDASKNDMISSIEGKIVGNNDSVPASFRQLIKEAAHGN
jgi:DNA-binding NarL/FixJ family response regulator